MRIGILVPRGITEIPWTLIYVVYMMEGFRMLIPRGKSECLLVFDNYNEALRAMDRLNVGQI